jgi:hypothetical protein
MSKVDLREVDITLEGEGLENFVINEVSMNSVVNALPSVTVRGVRVPSTGDGAALMTAEQGAVSTSLEQTAADLSAEQNSMFSKEVLARLVVNDDGKGNGAAIEGYLSAPALQVSTGRVMEAHSFIHSDYKMSGLNMTIYNRRGAVGSSNDNSPSTIMPGLIGPQKSNCSVAQTIEILIAAMLNVDPVAKDYFQIQNKNAQGDAFLSDTHAKNVDVFQKVVQPILQSNYGSTELKLPSAGKPQLDKEKYQSWFFGQLATANFISSLSSISSSFLLQQTTGFDAAETLTELAHSQVNTGPAGGGGFNEYYRDGMGEGIPLEVVNLQYKLGGLGELPLAQIIVKPRVKVLVGGANYNGYEDTGQESLTEIMTPGALWPLKKAPEHGEVKSRSLPGWCGVGISWKEPTGSPPVEKGQGGRNVQKNVKKMDKDVKDRDVVAAQTLIGFGGYWARKIYTTQALQTTSCTVTIPFDINWGCVNTGDPFPVGRVYKIAAANFKDIGTDITLFEGYLHGVSHDVAVGPSQGRALTHLTFSHVKGVNWNGFEPSYGCGPWVEPV